MPLMIYFIRKNDNPVFTNTAIVPRERNVL